MDMLKQYLLRAKEIIGDRSQAEELYDNEVLPGLRNGSSILESITLANQKFPGEALEVDASNIQDVTSHYEFLLEYENIRQKALR